MSRSTPPRLAVALLRRFLPANEPLAGDLLERFAARPDRLWFWREVLAAVVLGAFDRRNLEHPLGLAEGSPFMPAGRARRRTLPRQINLSASPIRDIGGLGLVVLGVLVSVVRPEMWIVVAAANLGGAALGLAVALLRRSRGLSGPPTTPRLLRCA